ncbi:MAG: hypothetical protein WDZ80_05725 [Candidatus Paceibacterota bacterium]
MTNETKDFVKKNDYSKSLKLINKGCDYEEVVPELVSESKSTKDLIENIKSFKDCRLLVQLAINHELSDEDKANIIHFLMDENELFWIRILIEKNLITGITLKVTLHWILEGHGRAVILYEIASKIDPSLLDQGDKYRFLSAIQKVNDRHWDRYFKEINWITESEKQFLSMNI